MYFGQETRRSSRNQKVVEIKVNELKQLFDERDPAPFREKDLDDDAVSYIVSSVQDISPEKVEKLLIHVNKEMHTAVQKEDAIKAIHEFFLYESEQMAKKIRAELRVGVKSLIIGAAFLTIAVSFALLIPENTKSFWPLFFKEGLFLTGWVSMWKPINIFLYEWWPLYDIKKTYICLSNINIDFIEAP
ncbi:MAG: hypothetical protein IT291_00125 [Deltaproteobacteria bacterium]|nr:hypothetical protein [Deltaproteobacteria bacterium]